MKGTRSVWIAGFAFLAGGAACSASRAASTLGSDGGFDGSDDAGPAPPMIGVGTGGVGQEVEQEAAFQAPVTSGPYIWTANPESDRVARVDARDLSVSIFDVGHGPKYLTAFQLPDGRLGAITANTGSRDLSLILESDADASGAEVFTLSAHLGVNAWSAGERVLVAWSARGASPGTPDEQTVTIVDLNDEPRSFQIGVGFGASQAVVLDQDRRLVVASEQGLSVLRLIPGDEPQFERDIALPVEAAQANDIAFTADGQHALVRQEGLAQLLLVDLDEGTMEPVELPERATDLDMSSDGDLALVVCRAPLETDDGQGGQGGLGASEIALESTVALVRVSSLVAGQSDLRLVTVPDVVGSVSLSAHASSAVLFTNAYPTETAWVMNLETADLRSIDLRAQAQAVLVADDGEHAVALLKAPGDSQRTGAFGVIPLNAARPIRIEGIDEFPTQVALSPKGTGALVTGANASGSGSSYRIAFPELTVDRIRLPSVPLATGITEVGDAGYVAQSHPEGRLTVIPLGQGAVQTITGFELSGKVTQ
jgi:hypothetical protein